MERYHKEIKLIDRIIANAKYHQDYINVMYDNSFYKEFYNGQKYLITEITDYLYRLRGEYVDKDNANRESDLYREKRSKRPADLKKSND